MTCWGEDSWKHVIMALLMMLFAVLTLPLKAEAQPTAAGAHQKVKQTSLPDVLQPLNVPMRDERPVCPQTTLLNIQAASDKNRKDEIIAIADIVHKTISTRLLASAAWLDAFFADERSVAEENTSYLGLRHELFVEERTGFTQKPRARLRLALPQLQQKANLIFSTEPDRPAASAPFALDDLSDMQRARPPHRRESDDTRFITALQYFLKATTAQNISLRAGLRFNGMDPVVLAGPRYRVLTPLNAWAFRLTQEVLYRTDTKWQAITRLDLERPLSKSLFFRSTLEGGWYEDNGYSYTAGFSLGQILSEKSAISYEWINSFHVNGGSDWKDTLLKVHYRWNIWRNWLFVDIAPQFRFPCEHDHQLTPGIFVSLEALFGWASSFAVKQPLFK